MVGAAKKASFVARPWLTLLLALGSLAIWQWPVLAGFAIYDRTLILQGEFWRLATGVLVHFSRSHLGYDLALFVASGVWLERGDATGYRWLVALIVLLSGLSLLVFKPQMQQYGGLSGIVTGNVVYLALSEMRLGTRAYPYWLGVLALLGVKIVYELLTRHALFVSAGSSSDSVTFQVAPIVHIVGAGVAVAWFLLRRGYLRRRSA